MLFIVTSFNTEMPKKTFQNYEMKINHVVFVNFRFRNILSHVK